LRAEWYAMLNKHVSTQDLGSEGIGLGVAEIDFQRLETVRAAMPISNHRRFARY
jgi:hypothetical protein